MGRRKAVGKRSDHVKVTTVDAPIDQPFPDSIFSYFQRRQSGSHDTEHPSKRRKTDVASPVDSVTILREDLIIRRPNSGEFDAFSLSNLQTAFKFELHDLVDSEPESNRITSPFLSISTRLSSRKEAEACCMTFPLKLEEMSHSTASLLTTRDTFWFNPNVEDSCWIMVDAAFEAMASTTTLTLTFRVRWNISTNTYMSSLSPYQRKFRKEMLAKAYPDLFKRNERAPNSCSPKAFYEAAHVPDPSDTPPETISVIGLTAKLYPFQRRAVKWMLRREGVEWIQDNDGNSATEEIGHSCFDAPSSFIEMKDADGRACHISPLLCKVTKDLGSIQDVEQNIRGGILSEEMGLGKTVELLALFSLHPQPPSPAEGFDYYLGEQVKMTKATLIVAPSSLTKQWLSELEKHAPDLHVMHYHGLSQSSREHTSKANALIEKLRTHDVVITTYSVLTSELDYAMGEPDRARRAPRKYHRPRSPLVQIRWWRVCMDEAQMIESGVSKSATLARLLPRVNAWGVTGTPVKDSVEDLRGLLFFLRYEPFASNIHAWNTLIQSHEDGFKRLFSQISLRHSKRLVRHEIDIPPQKRYVITMPFTTIEEQHYQTLFKQVVDACGLSPNGAPLREDWDPDDPWVLERMRAALDRLRQTALHPEVGSRNRRALGHRNGPMRTLAEMLDVLIDQSESSIRTDQRSLLSAKLARGQLMENSPRVKTALQIWEGVLQTSLTMVDECRKYLRHEINQAKATKSGTRRTTSEDESDDETDESYAGRVGEARRRLRSALEIHHKATFFCANAFFQIKSNQDMTQPDSVEFQKLDKLESESYERAKSLRREILEESRHKAIKLMRRISISASEQSFATIPEYEGLGPKGIESRSIAESLMVLAAELNDQAVQLDDWREHVIQLLLKPLVDEEAEAEAELTGEEYEDSTKLMEEIVVYIQVLRTSIADRQEALTGEVNRLVEHEAKMSLRTAKENEGPFPEKLIELFRLRQQVKPKSRRSSLRNTSVKSSLFELRAASSKLRNDANNGSSRARIELGIIMEQLKATQSQLTKQSKIVIAMEQELDLFTTTMNARVEFYRQLQSVSDMLKPYEGPTGDAQERNLLKQEELLTAKLESAQARHRYLLNEKDSTDASRMCVICREEFNKGILAVCGHQFCKECITHWQQAHHNCPVCKRHLKQSNLYDITYKPLALKVQSEPNGPGTTPQTWKLNDNGERVEARFNSSAIYTEFSAEKLEEIRNINLEGPAFTTKVDNLARHLIWLRENDPGAKSIVFSQYTDFLSVLGLAFRRQGIGFTSFDKPNGTTDFKEDPSVEVFLLHARAHSSGLNLTNAAHVFLCEPLINTAIELQAIARVHRIGQEQETTVWLYIVDGTVEESIYSLSLRRRLKHLHNFPQNKKGKGGSNNSAPSLADDDALEAANSMELEQASLSRLMGKGKTQGEAVEKGDLWECLFGHVKGNSGELQNSGPTLRGLLAAEAAEQRGL